MEKIVFFGAVVVVGVAAMCYVTFRFISNEINILKTTLCAGKGLPSKLCEEYINSLFNQISEVRAENLKLRSDLELNKIEIEAYKMRIEKLLEENKEIKYKLENKQIAIIKGEE